MSTATKTLLILVKQQGLDQVQTAVKGLTSTSSAATKATTGLGSAFAKGQGDALKLRTGVMNLDKAEKTATKSVDNFGKSADTAAKKTSGLAAKFQGNKGLIFATVGIATAGLEAVGMFQQFQNAQGKVAEATTRLNTLEAAGLQHTQAYRDAQHDLTDANRGLSFAFRILALSAGDLIPFSLLLINSFVKLKDTVGTAKPAVDAAAKTITGLGTAANTTSGGGLKNLFNSFTQSVTGAKNFDTGLKTANTTTGTFNNALGNLQTGFTNTNTKVLDATRFIGTSNSGLVGGVSGLSVAMDESNKRSTKFKEAFANIGTSVKNLPNTFKNIGASIGSFFTNFGTNIGKFGGLLKTAGSAALTFGKTLAMAMLSNPITAIIAGISAAVLALATDFGGIRTAANNFGVALGNAIPAAKGILQAIGDAANGALDAVAGFLGLQKELDKTGTIAQAAAAKFQPLKTAIETTIGTSVKINTLRDTVEKLGYGVDFMTKNSIQGLKGFRTAVENALTQTERQTPAVSKVMDELDATIKKTSASGYDLSKAKTELNAVLSKLQVALLNTGTATNKEAAALIESGKHSKTLSAATGGLIDSKADLKAQVIQLKAELSLENKVVGEQSKALAESRQAVQGWVNDMGMAETATDAQYESLILIAPALKTIGEHIDLTGGKVVDLGAALLSMAATQEDVKAKALDLWGTMAAGINSIGKDALPVVESAMKVLKDLHPEIAAEVEKLYSSWQENTIETKDGIFLVNEAEQEQAKDVKSAGEALKEKADKLGIYNKIQKLSLTDQATAIKITEDQTKAENAARATLQNLATARGLDISLIGKSSAALFNYIQASDGSVATMDDVYAAAGQLIDARQQEAKATEIETEAADIFMQTLDQTAPVLGMTGKGLLQVSKNMDDTAKATSIAADEVGTWWTELKKSQAVEDATITKLEELAKDLGITIPDSIKKEGIPAIEEYIQKVTGIGPAAKKAADEAKKAFNDMANEASGAIQDMIKEDVLAGKGKKVEKILEDIGLAADSLAGKQAIIEVGANTVDFEDKISSIPELVISMLEGIPPQTTAQADAIITAFADSMESELGNRIPGIGQTIESVWDYVKSSAKPGESAAQMVERFRNEIMKDPALFAKAAQAGIVDPLTGQIQTGLGAMPGMASGKMQEVANALGGHVSTFEGEGAKLAGATTQGYTSGSGGLISAGQQAMINLLAPYGKAAQDAYTKSQGIISSTASGIQSGAGTIQNATLAGIVNPVTGQIDTIPGQAQTGIAPVEGIFSQAFLAASNAAGAQLTTMVTTLHTAMSNMSTSVKTYSDSMAQNFILGFLQKSAEAITIFSPEVTKLQGAFSTLSTSVGTYSTSMSGNINKFATAAGTSFGKVASSAKTAQGQLSNMSTSVSSYMSSMSSKVSSFASSFSSAMSKVKSQADAAKKSVDALAKSIAALKSKSITIHVGLSGPGVAYLRHGGATINFPSESGVSYAASGKSWLQKTPKMIGNTHVAETFPEIVSVMPLDPREKASPFNKINKNLEVPSPQMIPMGGAGGNGGGRQPIHVELHTTISMPDGKVLAKAVQQHLLEGFSGVTS